MELPDRYALEAQFAAKLARLTTRQRVRLRALMGSPPNPKNVPPAFWDEVRREMEDEAAVALYLLFLSSATFHAEAAEGKKEPGLVAGSFDNAAQSWGRNRAATLATSYAATARDVFAETMAALKQQQEAGQRVTRQQFEDELTKIFGPAKAEQIARTETTAAQSAGGEAGVESTVGVSAADVWLNHPELSRSGPCPTCKPLHNTTRVQWARQFPAGPPCHLNCVCSIKYSNVKAK